MLKTVYFLFAFLPLCNFASAQDSVQKIELSPGSKIKLSASSETDVYCLGSQKQEKKIVSYVCRRYKNPNSVHDHIVIYGIFSDGALFPAEGNFGSMTECLSMVEIMSRNLK